MNDDRPPYRRSWADWTDEDDTTPGYADEFDDSDYASEPYQQALKEGLGRRGGTPIWIVGLVVAVAVGVLLVGVINQRPTPSIDAPPAPTATNAATVINAPQATDTPTGPRTVDTATLGGTADVWTAAYGQPNEYGQPNTNSYYPSYSITTTEGYKVVLTFGGTAPGTDGKQRDDRVVLAPQVGTGVPTQQLAAILPRYLPADTMHVRDFTDPQIGLIHVYSSADLAATFPATDFTDSNTGQPLPPGTFSAACDQPGPPECDVVLGD